MGARVLIWAALIAACWIDTSYFNGLHLGALVAVAKNIGTAMIGVMPR